MQLTPLHQDLGNTANELVGSRVYQLIFTIMTCA